ncbi:polyprenyl synthetase family protein [bacterium]|nr:polyprenyl synthetase family protein [bacterium]
MENDLKTLFSARKGKIIETLSEFLLRPDTKERLRLPWIDDLPERLLAYTSGGKCLRGNLVLLGAEAAGADIAPLYPAAAAIELFQSGILMHDDIIDEDDTRRGKPSAHCAFAKELSMAGFPEAKKTGESLAICLGDIALMLTFALLMETKCDASKKSEAAIYWGREFAKVGAAEMEDTYLSGAQFMPEEKRILDLYIGKTAGYTFIVPLLTGGMLGGASIELLSALSDYALNLGVLFQVKDDELGLFGSAEKLGKPIGSDIRENKKTIFTQKLFAAAGDEEKKKLDAIFGAPNIGEAEVGYVRGLLEGKGIRKEIDDYANSLADKARSALSKAEVKNGKNILQALIELSLKRTA